MNFRKIKKIILIFTLGIIAFLINNADVYAANTTCTYSVLNGQYNLTYTITPNGKEGANITNSEIKCNTSNCNLKFANGGDMLTSNNFVSNSKKTIGCPSVLYYEVGYNQAQRSNYLKVSAADFNKSLGTISLSGSTNNNQSIAAQSSDTNAVKLLRTCKITGKSVTGKGGSSNVNVKVYSDGTLDFEATDSSYKVVKNSDITYDMFKNSCPSGIVLQCGGDGSNKVCNLTTSANVIGEQGTTTEEATDLDAQEKKNSSVSEHGSTKVDSGDISCEGLLGDDVMDDIRKILDWIKIAVPVLLVILGTLDFSKAVLADDPKTLNKATSTFIKRVIAAIALFFAPYLIMFILEHVDKIAGGCDIRDFF